MTRMNKQNIFLFVSIIFLVTLLGIYSYRFIYYKNYAPRIADNIIDLKERILKKNILEKDNDTYYFKGQTNSNYVIYSSQLWQVVKLNNDGITLVSVKPITNIYFDTNYEKSIVNEFLTDDFYSIVDDSLLISTTTCVNDIISSKDNCDKTYTNSVTLPSLSLYEKIGGKNSYINNGYYTYLSNEGTSHYFIDNNGNIGSTSDNELYGVKALITIRSTDIISGSGLRNDPYILDNPKTKLIDALVGSYVSYSGKLWRIIKNKNETRLISNEIINTFDYKKETFGEDNELYQYLNTEFLEDLDKKYLVESTFYNGTFDTNIKTLFTKVKAFVGIPFLLDFYLNDIDNYALMTYSKYASTIFTIKDNGITHKGITDNYGIRPIISIQNNLKINGKGTINSPYIIEGELDEETKIKENN